MTSGGLAPAPSAGSRGSAPGDPDGQTVATPGSVWRPAASTKVKAGAKSRWWRLPLVVGALLLVALGCRTPVQGNRAGVSFVECPAEFSSQLAQFAPNLAPQIDLGCGQLRVPLDYANPGGEQITLQLIRARHTGQFGRIGSLVFNPGGPGDPGVPYVPFLLSVVPEPVLRRFDLVSLDPRGTGGSAPINCPSVPGDAAPRAPNVLTAAEFEQAAQVEQQHSQACLQALTSRAPHFNTQAAARDIDRVRLAIGDETLTFLGASYGAKVGAEYAHQFPGSVRAAVLDGPSQPSTTVFESIVQQTRGFEEGFDRYAEGCRRRTTCKLGDPHAFLARLVARADAAPVPSTRAGGARRADGGDVLDAVRAALYAEDRWGDLDEILDETGRGNSAGVFALIDNAYGPQVDDSAPADQSDANYVINCNDSAVGPTDEQIRATARAMARDYPLFGTHTTAALFACKTWQPQRSVLEPPIAATPNRILVVGTRHDAATPYAGAVALTAALGNATLLTWEGNNHTALTYSTCIADAVARYLIHLTVPPEGTRCPPE